MCSQNTDDMVQAMGKGNDSVSQYHDNFIYIKAFQLLVSKCMHLTIRRRLHKFDLHSRLPGKTPLLLKIKARLQFANEHIGRKNTFWSNVLCTNESNIELFGHGNSKHVWPTFQETIVIPTVMEILWFQVALLHQGLDSLH